MVPALQKNVIGAATAGLRLLDLAGLFARELHRQGLHDLAYDLVLQREDLGPVAIVPFGPEMVPAQRVNELCVHTHEIGFAPDAPFEDVAHPQVLGDLLHLDRLAPVCPRGVPRDDKDAGELGQVRDQVFRHAVGEVVLRRVVAQVVERQHRDRRLVGQRQSRLLDRCGLALWRPRLPPSQGGGDPEASQSGRRQRPAAAPRPDCYRLDRRNQGRRPLVQHHGKGMDGTGDVLDLDLAAILEVEIQLVAYLIVHGAAQADPARIGQALEPCGQVHAVAIDVVALDDDVADVDADAKHYLLVFRDACVALTHRALDLDGEGNGLHHTGKLHQRAVAHELNGAAVVL